MKNVYLYIRVSTDEQADTGYSQRSQDEMLRRYCEINGFNIKAAYFEDHSAKTFIRPEFAKLLLSIRKHKGIIDLVLFTKWDRFSRNAGDAYQMINTLHKLGVDPQAIEQPLNLEIPENKMMLAFYLAAPEVENDRRALNVLSGLRRAQKEGRWVNHAPIGYKNKTGENGKKYIAIDPVTGPLMKWAFNEIAAGKFTTESILKQCRVKGLTCSKNNFWHAIRHPLYCGKIKVRGWKNEEEQLVQGQHSPLISEALFYDVQDVLNGRKKVQRTKVTADERFPLRGFLVCPGCSKVLTASSSRGRKNLYSYYHCNSKCGVRFSADYANEKFIQQLQTWKPHPAVQVLYKVIIEEVYLQEQKNRNADIKKIREEMKLYDARQTKARELLMTDSIEADDYKSIKKECEQRTRELEARWSNLISKTEDIQPLMDKAMRLLGSIDEIYAEANIVNKRELIGSMFPEKLQFSGEAYRTTRINEAVQLIYSLGNTFEEINLGNSAEKAAMYQSVTPLVHFSNHFLYDLRKLVQLHDKIFNAA